jgi:hypothetical protein
MAEEIKIVEGKMNPQKSNPPAFGFEPPISPLSKKGGSPQDGGVRKSGGLKIHDTRFQSKERPRETSVS